MLKIKCYICKKELTEPGALLFSPPTDYIVTMGDVKKYHICHYCYWQLEAYIKKFSKILVPDKHKK